MDPGSHALARFTLVLYTSVGACSHPPARHRHALADVIPAPVPYLPASHALHVVASVWVAYVPAVQDVQVPDVVMPDPLEYFPAPQSSHAAPVKPSTAWYFPAAHRVHALVAASLYDPLAQLYGQVVVVAPESVYAWPSTFMFVHALHTRFVLFVHAEAREKPAPQSLLLGLAVAAAQVVQVVEPSALAKFVPSVQSVQSVTDVPPGVDRNVPTGHATQPEVSMYCPAGHSATHVVVPPLAKRPVGQAVQTVKPEPST